MNELGKNYLDWELEGCMRREFKKLRSNVLKIMREDGWSETHDITKICKELETTLGRVKRIKTVMIGLDEMVENGSITKFNTHEDHTGNLFGIPDDKEKL